VNGELVFETGPAPVSKWLQISIPLTSIQPSRTFVCEIQLHLDHLEDAAFAANTFQVRRRHFAGSGTSAKFASLLLKCLSVSRI
jgi:hypothetical protein